MKTTITARRLLTDFGKIDFPVITITDGLIADISSDPGLLAHETDTLTAAFLDIHTHGAMGHDVMQATPAGLSTIQLFLAQHGVAHYLPTTVTASIDDTLRALESLATAIESAPAPNEAQPIGIHLEGPFISHAKRGVHPTAHLQPPSIELFNRFQSAARGHIKLVTLAPEPDASNQKLDHKLGGPRLASETWVPTNSVATNKSGGPRLDSETWVPTNSVATNKSGATNSVATNKSGGPRLDSETWVTTNSVATNKSGGPRLASETWVATNSVATNKSGGPRLAPETWVATNSVATNKSGATNSVATNKSGGPRLDSETWVTTNPESSPLPLIRHLKSQDIRISLGHSNALAADTLAAITAGATSATHAFNAMRALDHREPGILGTVLDDDRLYAELICDGIHVAPPLVRLWLKAKGPHRAILVTDSMSATGMPEGNYTLGNLAVTVANGTALLAEDLANGKRTLAGSVLTLDAAVANLQSFTQSPLSEATRLASHNPAAMLGQSHLTRLTPGTPANLNRFNARNQLIATYIRGINL